MSENEQRASGTVEPVLDCKCGCDEFVWYIESQGRYSSRTDRKYYDPRRHPGAVCRACNRDIKANAAGQTPAAHKETP